MPYFAGYTAADGLGGQAVNDVLVDADGYLWSGGYAGLHRFDGYDFVAFPADITDTTALSHDLVTSIVRGTEGTVWVGTRVGINRYDSRTGTFRRWFAEDGLPSNDIRAVVPTKKGVLVATTGGLCRLWEGTQTFVPASEMTDSVFLCLYQDLGDFTLVGGTESGISGIDRDGKLRHYACPGPEENLPVTALATFAGDLYAGTYGGLFRFDPLEGKMVKFFPPDHPLANTFLKDLLVFRDKLWVATRGQGLINIDKSGTVEHFLPLSTGENGLLDVHNRSLATDERGTLWIGSYRGMNCYQPDNFLQRYLFPSDDPNGNQILQLGILPEGKLMAYRRLRGLFLSEGPGNPGVQAPFPKNEYWIDRDLNDIYTDRSGTTWLPRGREGLRGYRSATDTWLPLHTSTRMRATRLNCLTEDANADGILWIGTADGLLRYEPQTSAEEWFTPAALTDSKVLAIAPAPSGGVWLAIGDYSHTKICRFDPETREFTFVSFADSLPVIAQDLRVESLQFTPDGKLWALANQGLVRIDPATNSATLLHHHADLGIDIPRDMWIDRKGLLWIGTDRYLYHYDPATGKLRKFPLGAAGSVINRCAVADSTGRIYFGTYGGILTFHPDSLVEEIHFPPLVLNELLVNGRSAELPLEKDNVRRVALRRHERTLRLDFAALSFATARTPRYAYRRPRENEKWQELGSSRSLTLTNLTAGNTTVQLRSDDGQGNWNPVPLTLEFAVAAYWYERSWVRIGFLFLMLAGIYALGRFLLRRRLEREAHARLVELDEFKSRVFTNLTHEFRTPLTLILGPARRLSKTAVAAGDETLGREARRIKRQGKRLLRMINQLLDLRKLEAGKLEISTSPTSLNAFFRELLSDFSTSARSKQIDLVLTTDFSEETYALLDRDKQHSILANLVANALRFTPAGGRVEIKIGPSPAGWQLSVKDNGPGIAATERARIFAPFVQAVGTASGGTGIGLSLTRELCILLGGKLELESEVGRGSCFRAEFPFVVAEADTRVAAKPSGEKPEVLTEKAERAEDAHKPLLLVVEDDEDVAEFLAESLQSGFQVLTAHDGDQGLALATEHVPDLVVSDVMMPGLNGLQLCARLKADARTRHVPVLLLTARSAEEHRLEGLESGADAYLSKPFRERELHLRLRNLLALRGTSKAPAAPPLPPSPETEWLVRLRGLIIEHLANRELNGGFLERELGISRSHLHRKLQDSLGLSPTRLINQLRLEAAAERLRNSHKSISEIAYACGYGDPAYFSRKFRERYGVSPSVWRSRNMLDS